MKYIVKFVYNDGKELDVGVEEENLQQYFSSLHANQVYWFEESRDLGMWLDLDKVRYVHLRKEEEQHEQESHEREDKPSESELLMPDDSDSDREGDAEPA